MGLNTKTGAKKMMVVPNCINQGDLNNSFNVVFMTFLFKSVVYSSTTSENSFFKVL